MKTTAREILNDFAGEKLDYWESWSSWYCYYMFCHFILAFGRKKPSKIHKAIFGVRRQCPGRLFCGRFSGPIDQCPIHSVQQYNGNPTGMGVQ